MHKTLTIQDADSAQETCELMRVRLNGIVPDFEIAEKADIAFRINQLKRENNAIILGHNYMEPALFHAVPDYVGDSLALARVSSETDAQTIVVCGVLFMAETAKILSPGKTVLIPAEKAGCSLAEGIGAADVRALRQRYPDVPVVTYVNTYAEVKAESDYCCTSGNSAAVVRHLLEEGHQKIIFLPDEYLGRNTAAELGLRFILAEASGEEAEAVASATEPVLIGWGARCEVHDRFCVDDVRNARAQFPDVVVLAHPECHPDVIAEADISGSTKVMVDYVRDVDAPQYLLLTECSMGDNLAAEFPDREMVRMCSYHCEHMNLISLADTLAALRENKFEVNLDDDLVRRARLPIDRMLSIG